MRISIIAGARPNFMKIAPIIDKIRENRKIDIQYRIVHTGQHYDRNMSGKFFVELGIPKPDVNLECGSGTQAEQTANIMVRFEKDLMEHPADVVLVVGDVTSTVACSIVAKKLCTKVAHVEAGIRSGDLTMPEEINRIVTDSITDYFFTTSELANRNLQKIGAPDENIFFVGNTMIDTLLKQRSKFKKPSFWDKLDLSEKNYIVMTLHRPANVDGGLKLKALIDEIVRTSNPLPLIFPVHPRTSKILSNLNISYSRLHIVEPLSYLEFNYLVERAKAVITDSGGITEETSIMRVPCMTLRNSTERPETVTLGTNELLGTNLRAIKPAMERLFLGDWKAGGEIPLWDGKSAERIVEILHARASN
jgi:UDP-N-acetylglucosamine 2-epimerase (non-hydrolysing)